MTKLSIITPSYNQGQFIEETIQSILAQTYTPMEYIIIDGGSTDQTLNIIKKYDTDPRLSWISEPDKGLSDALNKGFSRATGNVFTWLNTDDVFLGQIATENMDYLAKNPTASVVYRQCVYTDKNGNCKNMPPFGKPFDLVTMLSDTGIIPQPGTFFRREVWQQIGEFRTDLHYTMDTEYWARISRYGELHFLAGIRSTYRQHEQSKTSEHALATWKERHQLLEELLNQPEQYPELFAAKNIARSNMAQHLAKYHTNKQQKRHYAWQAVRYSPIRKRLVYLLLLAIDASIGTNFSKILQQIWWRIKLGHVYDQNG